MNAKNTTIHLWVYCYHWNLDKNGQIPDAKALSFFTSELTPEVRGESMVLVGEIEADCSPLLSPLTAKDIVLQQVESLRAQIRIVGAEFEAKKTDIERRIAELLAIDWNGEAQ